MANIKFYRVVASYWDTVTPQEGFVWFNTDDRTISLYKNGVWEQYSGIKSATYVDNVLTVTPCVGDSVVVDFNALHADIYEELAKLEGITDKVTTYVVAAISAETSAREAADSAITDILNGTKNDDGSENTKGLVKEVEALRAEMNALGGIDGGDGIGGMIDAKIAALDVEDAAVDGQYVSSVAEVDGKVVVTRAALPVYEEVGVAAGLDAAMDARVKVLEAIDHSQLAADAASSAVATVLDGAPESFDTLKEVAAWIANNDHASDVATLMTDVENLKKIDHDAYVEADKTVLADAKAYANGLATNYEVAGAANQALVDAKSYTDEEIGKLSFDAAGSAAAAEAAAKTYADGLKTAIDGVIEENERVTAASLTDLDSRIVTLESVDHDAYVGADETVLSNAKTYADNLFTWAEY